MVCIVVCKTAGLKENMRVCSVEQTNSPKGGICQREVHRQRNNRANISVNSPKYLTKRRVRQMVYFALLAAIYRLDACGFSSTSIIQ